MNPIEHMLANFLKYPQNSCGHSDEDFVLIVDDSTEKFIDNWFKQNRIELSLTEEQIETWERLPPFSIKQVIELTKKHGGLTLKLEKVPKVNMQLRKEQNKFVIDFDDTCQHLVKGISQ